jgi:D-alanine--poly(phosphoribitol) ligase subunit 2
MTVPATDIEQSVFRAVDGYNATEGRTVPRSSDTVLLGDGGAVDSLGLVRLVMMVERQIEDDFRAPISLTDEKAMSQRSSPFRTLGTLTNYIGTCLNGA